MNCLVINAAYAPVDIQPLRKVLKKVFKQKAEVLATYADKRLQTWNDAMYAPAVIRLLHFVTAPKKNTRFMPFSRKNVWLRDKGLCQYCGERLALNDMHWDHVVPRDAGGKSCWTNIVCCCLPDNLKKNNRTPEEAGMRLLTKPVAPKFSMSREKEMILRLKSLKNFPHEAWRQYLYWNIPLDQD